MKSKEPQIWTQPKCCHTNALREYERCHRIWINCVVGTPEAKEAKRYLEVARENYLTAYQLAKNT